jgi:hypothetical protein
MHNLKKVSIFIAAIIVITAFFFNGCKEDQVTSPQEEHFEPEGLLIKPEGLPDTLVYYFQGAFLPGKDSLFVAVSDTSEHLDIDFLDASKNQIPAPSDNEHTLGWTVGNTGVANAFSDEPWAFHIIGVSADTTNITLKVLHNGHSDFTTLPVKIRVTP